MTSTNKILRSGKHQFTVNRDESLELFVFPEGASIDLDVTLAEPGAELMLNGLFIAGEQQQQLTTITVRHSAPYTSSNQLLKAILKDEAVVDIKGTIIIEPGCDEAEAHLLNNNLLLSDKAVIKAKPELQIDHDNVICSHGSATGQLDKEALFYLQSRGIPEQQAKQMLLESFVQEVVEGTVVEQEALAKLPKLTQYA